MCDFCDRPDLTLDEFLHRVSDIIHRNRFAVQAVSGSRCSAALHYSVGLTAHGLPEIAVLGVPQEDGVRLVRTWADYLLDESLVLPGELLTAGPYRMEAVGVERPEDVLLVADALYGADVRALQLVVADERGRWPWDQGYRSPRPGQPVLGTRAPQYCEEHRPDRIDVPPHP